MPIINGKEILFAGYSDDGKGNVSNRGAESVVNELLLALDGISFEKKGELNACECKCHIGQVYVGCSDCQKKHYLGEISEQKPFSVDNPPKEGEIFWSIDNSLGELKVRRGHFEVGVDEDEARLLDKNVFRTQKEAFGAFIRVLQALKS